MNKYFYIGCRVQQTVTTSTGSTRKQLIVRWNSTVYESAEQAAVACSSVMAKHLGISFFVQGFEKKLVIVDGESKGFENGAQ
jgi:hypothetical protein